MNIIIRQVLYFNYCISFSTTLEQVQCNLRPNYLALMFVGMFVQTFASSNSTTTYHSVEFFILVRKYYIALEICWLNLIVWN